MSTRGALRKRQARSARARVPKQSGRRAVARKMKRQFRVEITGGEPLVIDLVENEAINIHIQNNATKFLDPKMPVTTFHVTGHRWAKPDYFILNWGGRALSMGDSILIRIVESAERSTPPKEEEKYVEPEKDCSFCQRKASEVKQLLEANLFTRICSDCVEECYRKIYGRSAT